MLNLFLSVDWMADVRNLDMIHIHLLHYEEKEIPLGERACVFAGSISLFLIGAKRIVSLLKDFSSLTEDRTVTTL